jgi:predicted nucleic acid-binding protein
MKSYFVEIPEHIVEQAAEECRDDKDNNFLKCLNAAHQFRAANMTPVFLLDQNYQDLVVVAKETFKKKLH